jgi:hypothetical protein
VTGAKVLSMKYLLAGNKTLIAEQQLDEAALGWEFEFLELMKVSTVYE